MSDSQQSTAPVPVQTQPQAAESAQPDFANMTGEQAKAWVEAQKASGQPNPDSKPRASDGKFQPKAEAAPKEPSNQEAIKEAAKEAIKKWKVKVDGQEMEVDENELVRGYSHQKAANKKLQEGQAAKKQAIQFLEMMKDKSSLFDVIQKLGHDPRKLAEEYLVAQLEEESLDPKEKEYRQMKAKLQAVEDMERKQKESVEKQRLDEMKTKYAKDFEVQFVSALKESQLPPTKAMVSEMAKYISRSAKIGFKMTPQEAAQLVKEDVQKAQLGLIGNADGETLLKLLGDDVAAKILQARGSKVKQSQFQTPVEQGQPRELPSKDGKRMSRQEWREYNLKRK